MSTEKEYQAYTHEQRCQFAKQAADAYYAKEFGTPPPLDRAFMEKSKPPKSYYVKKRSAIAAGIMVAILSVTALNAAFLQEPAYGEKGLLHRMYQEKNGNLATDKQDSYLRQEETSGLIIYSMDNIADAIEFADGQLYVPQYLPEGYLLHQLSLEQDYEGRVTAEWCFKKGEKELSMVEMYTDGEGEVSVDGGKNSELIRLKDRIIYVHEKSQEEQGISVLTEYAMIGFGGPISAEEGIKIAKGLKQMKNS